MSTEHSPIQRRGPGEKEVVPRSIEDLVGSLASQIYMSPDQRANNPTITTLLGRIPAASLQDLGLIQNKSIEILGVLAGTNQRISPKLAEGFLRIGLAVGKRRAQIETPAERRLPK